MDIQGWLLGTTDRAPPDPSDGLAIQTSTFLPPASVEQRYHRKRQRATSDSSILAPRRLSNDRARKDQACRDVGKTGNRRHVNLPVVARPDSANLHDRSLSTVEANVVADRDKQALAKPYEKRARHKTKADRYEPKGRRGGEKRERGGRDDRKSGRKRDRPRRGGDGKRTEPLIQGFKLKNGPKNSRLTLNQDVSAGVFKHGRASAQVQGRNNGLPDLVFNELRFLQTPKDHQNEQHALRNQPTQHNEKPENYREEISAYFSKHQRRNSPDRSPAAAPKPTEQVCVPNRDASPGQSEARQAVSSPLLPDKELPAVPYLGFGSKGMVNRSSREPRPSSSASYLTWSESGGVLPVQRGSKIQFDKPLEAGQLSTQRRTHVQTSRQRQVDHVEHAQPVGGAPKQTGRIRDIKSPRRASKRQQPPPNNEVSHTKETEADVSMRDAQLGGVTSQSLPIAPRNAAKENARTDGEIPTSSSGAKSFDTADILNIKQRLTALAQQSPLNVSVDCHLPKSKENIHPPSTSSTTKVLRSAREALMQIHRDTLTKPPTMMMDQLDDLRVNLLEFPSHVGTFNAQHLPKQTPPGIGEDDVADHPGVSPWLPIDCYFDQDHTAEAQRAQEYSLVPPEETLATFPHGIYLDGSIAETSIRPNRMYTPGLHHERPGRHSPVTHARHFQWSRSGMSTRKSSSDKAFTARNAHLDDGIVADQTLEDGLQGFWRPHRLY